VGIKHLTCSSSLTNRAQPSCRMNMLHMNPRAQSLPWAISSSPSSRDCVPVPHHQSQNFIGFVEAAELAGILYLAAEDLLGLTVWRPAMSAAKNPSICTTFIALPPLQAPLGIRRGGQGRRKVRGSF
jgi:hypothetical protein